MFYLTDNIIVGNGEVPSIRTRHGIEWVLPGGRRTKERAIAEEYAAKMDRLISNNLKKYDRKILRK